MREEGERIGMKIKVVTRPDLSGCLFPDRRMESTGPSHLGSGANYTGHYSDSVLLF